MHTMFGQAFLLSQYSFICIQYFKYSNTWYAWYAIFFWQLVNRTADCFNNNRFIWVVKIGFKKGLWNNGKQFNVGKGFPVNNRNFELFRLVEAIFDIKAASLRRMSKKNLIILKSLKKNSFSIFILFAYRWHLSYQISIENVRQIVIFYCTYLVMSVLYLKFYSIL